MSNENNPKALKSLFSFFTKRQEPEEAKVVAAKEKRAEERKNPEEVKFSDPRRPAVPPPLKLESEESEKTSNHLILWQVYVLSGFLVLKWVWTRWKERKEGGDEKGSSDDDHSPADDDEYSHFSD